MQKGYDFEWFYTIYLSAKKNSPHKMGAMGVIPQNVPFTELPLS